MGGRLRHMYCEFSLEGLFCAILARQPWPGSLAREPSSCQLPLHTLAHALALWSVVAARGTCTWCRRLGTWQPIPVLVVG